MKRSLLLLILGLALVAIFVWFAGSNSPRPGPRAVDPEPQPSLPQPSEPTPSVLSNPRELVPPPAQSQHSFADCPLRGRIQSRSGTPLAGASVRWVREADGQREILGSVESNAQGEFGFELTSYANLSAHDVERSTWWLEAQAAMHQPLRQACPRPPNERLELTLSPGSSLRGQVLDAAQRAVAGASVQLVIQALQAGREQRTVIATTQSATDGSFELGYVSSSKLEVYARKENVGAALATLEVVAGAAPSLPALVLQGNGELNGFARFADGGAVADLELWAVPEAVAVQPNALARCVEDALEAERGSGLFFTRTITDANGAFRLAGLMSGKYMLRTPTTEVTFEPRFGYYSTGTDGIILSVDSQRLRVEVRDSENQPLRGASVSLVELSDAGDGSYESGQVWHVRSRGPNADASFNVQAETTYGIRVRAAGYEAFEELTLLAPGEPEQVKRVQLTRAQAPARLRLVLSSPKGPVSGARVMRLSPLTGAPDLELGVLTADADGWFAPLPAGEQQFSIGFEDQPQAPNWCLPVPRTELIQLSSGASREWALQLALGGRVELSLDWESAPAADSVWKEPSTVEASERVRLFQEHLSKHGAFVELEAREPAGSRSLHFWSAEGRVESQLLPGTQGRGVELLPPGEYTLKVQAPNCFFTSTTLQVIAGEWTRVRVSLRARS